MLRMKMVTLKHKTLAQVASFLHQLQFFVEMTSVEQKLQMTERIPTVEEYRERRMGSSAVGVCLAISE